MNGYFPDMSDLAEVLLQGCFGSDFVCWLRLCIFSNAHGLTAKIPHIYQTFREHGDHCQRKSSLKIANFYIFTVVINQAVCVWEYVFVQPCGRGAHIHLLMG